MSDTKRGRRLRAWWGIPLGVGLGLAPFAHGAIVPSAERQAFTQTTSASSSALVAPAPVPGGIAPVLSAAPVPAVAPGTAPKTGTAPVLPKLLRQVEDRQGVVAVNLGSHGIRSMRMRIMRKTAYTLGVQAGAYWREQQVNALLKQRAALLSQIFNMRPLLLDHGRVLPPVIDVVHGGVRLNSPVSGSSVVTTYRIEAPARLVSVPPNWRSWLWLSFPPLTRVSRLLLPQTDAEKALWKRAVAKGWDVGITLYNAAYEARLHALQRDYLGMVRFTILAQEHVVSLPRFATGSLGIQVNGHRLNIGQRLFRITWPTQFTPDGTWHPIAMPRAGTGQARAR